MQAGPVTTGLNEDRLTVASALGELALTERPSASDTDRSEALRDEKASGRLLRGGRVVMAILLAALCAVAAFGAESWRSRHLRARSRSLPDNGVPLSWRRPVDVAIVLFTVVAMIAGALWIPGGKS